MGSSCFNKFLLPTLLLILVILTACNLPDTDRPASAELNVTQAYETVAARLTQSGAQSPTVTLTPKPAESPTSLAPTDPAPATEIPPTRPIATAVCDRAAAGNPIDLTIPDNTQMQPGEAFTKKWALQNAGNCTWTRDYAVKFIYGERMGGQDSISLGGEVAPGQTVEIAIDMVAPTEPGTYRGNWKLRNASNELFGIGPNGSSPFWVQIIVVQSATSTPVPITSTPLPTPTATPTPVTQASGPVILLPGDRLDLDTVRANPESGVDLSYESSPDGGHLLVPQENVSIGIYGPTQPGLVECQAAAMDTAPIVVENLGSTYLCYRTDQGLPGWALVTVLNIDDFSLTLELLTWALP